MTAISDLIHGDPETLGGTAVSRGTRAPLRDVFDDPAGGNPLHEFPDDFPGVTRGQAIAVLRPAGQVLLERVTPA